jgi:hypothetical protein
MRSGSRDNGPPERWQHDKATVRSMKIGSGMATEDVVAVQYPTTLDRLYGTGLLGTDARGSDRRLEAGLWLLRCRGSAGLEPRVVGSYGSPGGDAEMSDEQAWNRKAYSEAIREMGVSARCVEALLDERYSPAILDMVKDGLDRVADMRGY